MKSTVKVLAVLLILIMSASLSVSCKSQPDTPDVESTTESEESKLNPNDIYQGTLK